MAVSGAVKTAFRKVTQVSSPTFGVAVQEIGRGRENNLGMGQAYWHTTGVNIPPVDGGWFNGGANLPDAIYVWNGLMIFDNADTSGYKTTLAQVDTMHG